MKCQTLFSWEKLEKYFEMPPERHCFNLYHSLYLISRRQFDDILNFPRKQDLTFHANWNVKTCFLEKK